MSETIDRVAQESQSLAQQRREVADRITIHDDVLDDVARRRILDYLQQPGWSFGWKSRSELDKFSFWHKHFAGAEKPDHYRIGDEDTVEDCSAELERNAPILYELWNFLSRDILRGHVLVRCYANGLTYGSDGTVHTDSKSDRSFTVIYYPHSRWRPDWAGETAFFNQDGNDILAAVYPRPNRLVAFPGNMQHVARGVSRTCPAVRITLMFKTEIPG